MENIAPDEARAALDAADRAQRQVAAEVGLPRGYWWAMAAGWIVLGVIGAYGPWWLISIATLLFGAGHAALARRLLSGRMRTDQLQVSGAVASRRIPALVVGILVVLVAVTVGAAFALGADGADHPGIWAAVFVAAIVGFGGPEILRVLRGWAHA
ncbi:hypothetical protein [Nocardia vermiculata]|uniref:Uncharacterized protein n=1 Tax=Nocardia vermiculata TaxID=257274 RepID=A0A846Y790_9NOCA|nr:hypothetical protein [Nocardia vermiculata]NKY53581.1 hypothetical protein [Nocardia vermiculata]